MKSWQRLGTRLVAWFYEVSGHIVGREGFEFGHFNAAASSASCSQGSRPIQRTSLPTAFGGG
jgi:hypothetical protein